MAKEYFCHIHPMTQLICPRCQGAKGGKVTAKKHVAKLSKWGRKGGRAKNKKK